MAVDGFACHLWQSVAALANAVSLCSKIFSDGMFSALKMYQCAFSVQ